MKLLTIVTLLTISIGMLNAGIAWDWAVQTNCNSIAVQGMTIDKKDNVYLATKFFGDFTFGSKVIKPVGGEDILILKYDNTGKLLWALPAGGTDTDNALTIAISPSGGIYAAGNFVKEASFGTIKVSSSDDQNHDIFVAKISEDGKWEWVKTYGSQNEETVFGLAVDSKNNIYLAGGFNESLTIGTTELSTDNYVPAFFLAMLKGKGEADWAIPIRLVSDGYINKLVLNHKEQPAIAGNFDTEMDVDTEIIMMSNGGWDGFVIQFDNTGYALWAKYFGGEATDSVNDMVCDKNGNLYITGNFSGVMDMGKELISPAYEPDIFAAKLSPEGNFLWANSCGGANDQYSVALALKPNGSVLVGGSYYDAMSLENIGLLEDNIEGVFVAELDKNGEWQSLLGAKGDNIESVRHLVCDSMGNVIAVGDFMETLTLGKTTLTTNSDGYNDKSLFLSKVKGVK